MIHLHSAGAPLPPQSVPAPAVDPTPGPVPAPGAIPAPAGVGRFRMHRRPRNRPAPVPSGAIAIAPPPRIGQEATHGWPLLLPLLSGAGSLPLLLASPGSGRRWLLGMAASLLLSTGAGLGLRLLARRASERARRRERARYVAHLQDVAAAAARVAALQRAAAEHLHPDAAALVAMIDAGERVWERSRGDEDFLELRLGLGPVAPAVPVHLDLGHDPLADYDPELLAMAHDLARRCSRLDAMPVTLLLRRAGVIAVRGRPEASRALVRSILLRSATFHAPRDLRILALFPPDAAPAWDWLKWLPHARDEGPAAAPGDEPESPGTLSVTPGHGVAPRPAGISGTPAVPRCLLAVTTRQAADLLERELRPRLARPDPGPLAADILAAGSPPGVPPGTAPGPARGATPGPGAAGGAASRPPDGGPAHLLAVVDGYAPHAPVGCLPVLDKLLRAAPALDATVLCLVDRAADEPSATRLRVELDDQCGLAMTEVASGARGVAAVRADQAGLALSEAVARRLAPLWLDDPTGPPTEHAEPCGPRLLDVLGMADPGAIELSQVWHPRPEAEFLRVPIGRLGGESTGLPLSTQARSSAGLPAGAVPGRPVALDLKEAAEGGMGPHGLLVGATGSGKSELLRTIVAALALTHPPESLAFVLVDFKGGATFAGLAGLPHTAGLITNLQADSTMVDRARVALRGELERRQRLLRDAGDLDGIASYQRLRSAGQRLEPLPRLLLVVDEFGELLAAHPEFLELFTAIGRTGRSLGIHLLLASQRLDEGRLRGLDSHLRYRICLRTFSPAESAAVLGTSAAHHLPPSPGHGLLKVDSGPCQRFKGLLVSTPTVQPPTAHEPAPAPALVAPFDPIVRPAGGPRADGPPHRPATQDARPGQDAHGGWGRAPAGREAPDAARHGDLDAVVSGMARVARAGRQTHRIWLPPLATNITLDQVLGSTVPSPVPGDPGWLQVPVGIVDRPFDQSQAPLVLDFTGRRGHLAIAGAPRSGKSTLLATLVAAFALTHRPEQVQFYCVDLGGGLLHALAALPHVGAVVGAHQPTQVARLVRELHALISEREACFRRHRIASMAAWHARRAEEPALDQTGYGEVFLVVDNWARLRQELGDLEAEIESLAGGGLHYGVHLAVAANRWAELRLALRDNIGGRLELRLNDPIESEIGRAAAARLRGRLPGRGLTARGNEFQVALPVLAPPDGLPRVADLAGGWLTGAREVARRAVRSTTGAGAPPLRPLPALVPAANLHPAANSPDPADPAESRSRGIDPITFAVHDHRLEVVRLDLAAAPHFLVLGDAGCGKTATLRCLAHGLTARHAPDELRLVVVDYRRSLVDLAEVAHCDTYACALSAAVEAVGRLRSVLDRRVPRSIRAEIDRRPRYILLVDDYDLVATARGNPLAPLVDLVAQGRDVGLHVLLARPVSGTARSAFEPFYQRLRETGCAGLIMSGDPREGLLLGDRAATPQPPGRGHLVTRHGRGGLIQVAWSPPHPTAPASDAPPAPTAAAGPTLSAGITPCPANDPDRVDARSRLGPS